MSDKQWDGKFSNLKISEDSNPELYSELAPLNHKGRSERLRFLASLGIMHLRQMNIGHMAQEVSRVKPKAKASEKSQPKNAKGSSVFTHSVKNTVAEVDTPSIQEQGSTGHPPSLDAPSVDSDRVIVDKVENTVDSFPTRQSGEGYSNGLARPNLDTEGDSEVLREEKGGDTMRSERSALNSKLLGGLLD